MTTIAQLENLSHKPAWKPPSREPADLWVERNVTLGGDSELQGRVSFDLLPMARYFLRACQNPEVRKVIAMVSAQSGKTKTTEFFLIHKVRNDPAPCAWFTEDDVSAKVFSQTRLEPDLRGCPALAGEYPRDRNRRKWSLIQLASMDLYVRGVTAKKQAEQISVQTVICDERRNYPPGRMQSVANRYKSFRDFKEISISTAGIELDDLHRAFNDGTKTVFMWRCPHCQHRQPFRFGRDETPLWPEKREAGGIVWETSAATKPGEHVWNFDAMRKTVRYECENPACRHQFHNWEKPRLIATMDEAHNWGAVETNPMATSGIVSMHWNELYMPWGECAWEKIAEKFLKAKVALSTKRDREPLKVFIQESLGEPWRDLAGEKVDHSELLKRCGEYSIGDPWPEDRTQWAFIMTVDMQHGFVVYIVRAYHRSGESRLVDLGKLIDLGEVRTYQLAHKILDRCVGVDVGWGASATTVYNECQKHGRWAGKMPDLWWDGWTPLLGDDAKDFTVSVDGKPMRRFWKAVDVDAGIGKAGMMKPLQRVNWCNDHYRETLYLHRTKGRLGQWTLPKNIATAADGKYIEQMSTTERVDVYDAEGKPVGNEWVEKGRHDYGDCELMNEVMAEANRVTGGG